MIPGNSGLQACLKQLDPNLSYGETKASLMSEFERIYVTRLLENHHGNLSIAARRARLDRCSKKDKDLFQVDLRK